MSKDRKVLYVLIAVGLIANIPAVKSTIAGTFANRVDSWRHPVAPKIIEEFKASIPIGYFRHDSGALVSKPISDLPQGIEAKPGTVTLFADYYAASHESSDKFLRGIPVYYINCSGHDMVVPHQDHDLFLKLEMRDADGKWVRCQPHRYSGCGNSYHPMPALPDGHFYCVVGYSPRSGRPSMVRYAIHNGQDRFASNEIEGFYSTDDLEMARYDEMAFAEGDVSFLEDFLTCRMKPKLLVEDFDMLRCAATQGLTSGRFPADEAWASLARVRRFDPTWKVNDFVTKDMLQKWHTGRANAANR